MQLWVGDAVNTTCMHTQQFRQEKRVSLCAPSRYHAWQSISVTCMSVALSWYVYVHNGHHSAEALEV